ncbi:MAG: serine hydrolase [Lewinellaceae bacterium]|nr:serine hydrolase [Lewinellaceae bacterium]
MKSTRLIFVFLFLVSFLGKSASQGIDPKLAEALQHTLDSMHQMLGIHGMGAAVQLSNNAVWAGGSGVSTLNPLDSVDYEHAFETGSTSKTITAACILQMADEGTLTLNDSLYEWLDTIQYINPNITIRQLLRHQSGIYDILQNTAFNVAMSQNINKIWSLEEVITAFIKAPAFQPGAGWAYSNTNYLLLGMIIEKAAGKSYIQEIADRFFTPMGLDSYANPAFTPLPVPVSHLWLDITGDGVLDDAFSFLTSRKSLFSSVGPAGGYFAKPSDLARWIRASMSGSLLSAETWAEATTTVSTPLPGGTKYGLGLMTRKYQGLNGYGHGGDLAGYSTQSFYFPEKDISIVVCSNDATIVSWDLANTVSALLKTYLECEPLLNATKPIESVNTTLLAFPNPFVNEINISTTLPIQVKEVVLVLTNVVGKKVAEFKMQRPLNGAWGTKLENLQSLPTGLYYLTVFGNGEMLGTSKVVKAHE